MSNWKTKQGLAYENSAVVRLGGVERFIPILAMRQNKVVVPLMLEVLPIIEAAGMRKDPETGELVMPPPEVSLRLFSEETLETMNRIVYVALTRAYDLTLDEYLDEPVTVHELTQAMPAIVKQTGFFRAAEEGRVKAKGEDAATS